MGKNYIQQKILKGSKNVKVGMFIKVKSKKHGNELLKITSKPYREYTKSLFIKVHNVRHNFDTSRSLQDCGIIKNNYNDRVTYVVIPVDCGHENKKVVGEANLHVGLPVLIRECQDCGAVHLGNGPNWYESWDNVPHWSD